MTSKLIWINDSIGELWVLFESAGVLFGKCRFNNGQVGTTVNDRFGIGTRYSTATLNWDSQIAIRPAAIGKGRPEWSGDRDVHCAGFSIAKSAPQYQVNVMRSPDHARYRPLQLFVLLFSVTGKRYPEDLGLH